MHSWRRKQLVLDGRAIDADAHNGQGRHAVPLRLVVGKKPQGLLLLPDRISPRESGRGSSPTSTACAGRWNSASAWISR